MEVETESGEPLALRTEPQSSEGSKLEGSNNGTTFTLISQGSVGAFSGRFIRQSLSFANAAPYTSYKLTFPTVANPATAAAMQIAEVELLGTIVTVPSPTYRITDVQYLAGAPPKLRITWQSQPGAIYVLEQSADLKLWQAFGGDQPSGGAASTVDIDLVGPVSNAIFLRVRIK